MRVFKCLAIGVLALQLSACADLLEDYTVSSEVVLQSDDGRVYILKEERASAWDGSEYVVWTGYNNSAYPVCGQITGNVQTDGGYSYGGVHTLPPNGSVVLATIGTGSSWYDYNVEQRLWPSEYNGQCYAYRE